MTTRAERREASFAWLVDNWRQPRVAFDDGRYRRLDTPVALVSAQVDPTLGPSVTVRLEAQWYQKVDGEWQPFDGIVAT